MPDQPQSRQKGKAGRDANIAGRDLTVHYYAAGAGEQAANDEPVLAGDVPQQPPGFQPRTDLLMALDASGPGVSVVYAVTGMRGVGKTQLAAAYARAKLVAGWRLVAWVNAEDPASLVGGLAAVAEAAGLGGPGGGDPGLAVRHWLEAGGDRCLLVFDNAADPDLLRPYLPVAGGARVLVTSNRGSVAELGEPVGVEVFTPEEAVAFLTVRTGLADAAGAGELAAELGFLPLGLAQAAAVIRGQRLGYATYLERLRALPMAGYLTPGPGQPYPYGVAETVLLSLQAVEAGDHSGTCGAVMWLLSVLSGTGTRRDLLHIADKAGMFGGKQLGAATVDAALGRLVEGSLLTFTIDGHTLIAHRLVLRVVRERLAQQRRLREVCLAAASMLGAYAVTLAESRDRLSRRDFSEQVVALQQIMAGLPDGTGESEAILLQLRWTALNFLNQLGESTPQVITVGELLVEDCERVLGADHFDTMTSRGMLASVYLAAGKTAESIALNERAMADMERVLGPDHPDTLTLRNNLANAYQAIGRRPEAMLLHEQTLADRERVLGPDHPDTLAARGNLANAYQGAGRYTEAIALYEQVLADFERLLGLEHPRSLILRSNLAIAYQVAGRVTEAIALHEEVLADRERVLGPDHPDTLTSRSMLASAYRAMGRTAEAIAINEQNLADRERVLGPDHPDTLASRNNLANTYQDVGQYAEAMTLHERTSADRERVLGPDHPDTLRSRSNVATAYHAAGRSTEAKALLEQNLADRERVLGPDHPDTLTSRNNLANACQEASPTTDSPSPRRWWDPRRRSSH
jgi:tetratricopeptide (TPR) repeat protein